MSYSAWFGTLHNDMEIDPHQFSLCPLDDLFPDVDCIWMEIAKIQMPFQFWRRGIVANHHSSN